MTILVSNLSKRLKSIGKDAGILGPAVTGKFPSEVNTDSSKLPHGFKRIGYDSDEQRYYFCDTSDNSTWVGNQGEEFGIMTKCGTSPLPSSSIESSSKSRFKSYKHVQDVVNQCKIDDAGDEDTGEESTTQCDDDEIEQFDLDCLKKTAEAQEKHQLAILENKRKIEEYRAAKPTHTEAFKENVSTMLGKWKTAVDPNNLKQAVLHRASSHSSPTDLSITGYVPIDSSEKHSQMLARSPSTSIKNEDSSTRSPSLKSAQSSLRNSSASSHKAQSYVPSITSSSSSAKRSHSHVLPLSAMASPPLPSNIPNISQTSVASSGNTIWTDGPRHYRPKYR